LGTGVKLRRAELKLQPKPHKSPFDSACHK
jgi:hypothetical protein